MACLETKIIFQAPIFHFHDYGRKGNIWMRQRLATVRKIETSFNFESESWQACLATEIFPLEHRMSTAGCLSTEFNHQLNKPIETPQCFHAPSASLERMEHVRSMETNRLLYTPKDLVDSNWFVFDQWFDTCC